MCGTFRYPRQVRRNIVRCEARRQGVPMRYLWRLMHTPRMAANPAMPRRHVPVWVLVAVSGITVAAIAWMVWRVSAGA